MSQDLDRLVGSFPGRRVVVVGDVLLDLYLRGHGSSLCREAPVPVVELDEQVAQPGGAANVAANLAALGGAVGLVGVVGADAEGEALRDALRSAGVDPSHLVVEQRGTTASKRRIVANGQIVARVDQHGSGPTTPAALVTRLGEQLDGADVLVVSDYGYGTVCEEVLALVADLRRRRPEVVVLADSRGPALLQRGLATGITPNYDEALAILGLPGRHGEGRIEQLQVSGQRLLEQTRAEFAAVTLDRQGAVLLARGRQPYRTYADPVDDSRTTGAGDTFLAALALVLAARGEHRAAIEVASAAAGVVCRSPGTAVCSNAALRQAIAPVHKQLDLASLVRRTEAHRAAGRRIVLTNGVFDLLHHSHVGFLSRAKALGDVLVVGVNSDDSTRRLKGPGRPVCGLDRRLRVLAELSCVDHVVAFESDDACGLLEALRPDVYVKGVGADQQELPERACADANGITLHLIPHEDESTSQLIARIRGS